MSGELKNSVKHQMYEVGKSWLEWATGPMKSSKVDKGMITPEEFVMAGDALVTKCPSWTWASAPSDKRVAYLPKNKQYIVIKRVPCMARARAPEAIKETNIDVEGEDWTLPETVGPAKGAVEDVVDIDGPSGGAAAGPEDIEDIESVDGDGSAKKPAAAAAAAAVDEVEEIDDPTAPPSAPAAADGASGAKSGDAASNPFSPRTYDVSITYDQTYATPRIWLMGYGANGAPLTESETCEDIWGDYSGETVTLLPHPFLGTPHVSVHPCKHAESMERMLRELNVNLKDRWEGEKGGAKGDGKAASGEGPSKAEAAAKLAGGDGAGGGPPKLGVEAYMFVFLKFMTCVVPTISYDNTRDLDF